MSKGNNLRATSSKRRASSGWEENPQLTPLGILYPLGPCKTTIPLERLDKVLQTLSNTFRSLSLQTKYQNSPLSATCRSLDQVEFAVSLFQASNKNDGNNPVVIVEIQRCHGPAMAFYQYARQILAAVSGRKAVTWPRRNRPVLTRISNRASNSNALLKQREEQPFTKSPDHQEVSARSALEMAWGMLKTDRADAQKLGLESIIHLTNPMTSGWSTSKCVAECLINKNKTKEAKKVWNFILNLVSLTPEEQAPENKSLVHVAWATISQLLQVAAKEPSLMKNAKELFSSSSSSTIIASMIQNVQQAQENPHCAFYAIQCLTILCQQEGYIPNDLRTRMKAILIEEKDAEESYPKNHLALEEASHTFLDTLLFVQQKA